MQIRWWGCRVFAGRVCNWTLGSTLIHFAVEAVKELSTAVGFISKCSRHGPARLIWPHGSPGHRASPHVETGIASLGGSPWIKQIFIPRPILPDGNDGEIKRFHLDGWWQSSPKTGYSSLSLFLSFSTCWPTWEKIPLLNHAEIIEREPSNGFNNK